MREGNYPDDWNERRKKVLRRDGYECQECGTTDSELHVHHITPISEGGGHSLKNLETLCESCHASHHPTLVTLRKAMSTNTTLRMRYYSPSSGAHTREFSPYALEMHNGMQLAIGFDSRHEEIRFFRPKRIQWVEETEKTFRPPDDFDAQSFLNENVDYGKTECFIATAAYGTSTASELDTLRGFRDDILLQIPLGSTIVSLYYQLSPPIAKWISRSKYRREYVRKYVVEPLVWLISQ